MEHLECPRPFPLATIQVPWLSATSTETINLMSACPTLKVIRSPFTSATVTVIFVPAGSQLSFLQGNGNGTFQSPQSFLADGNVESLIAADLNGDDTLDLISADYGGGAYVFLGNTGGTFQSPVQYASGRTSVI